jgi:hypothetical protein
MGAQQLNLMVKPQEFFREHVCQAASNQNITIEPHVEFYIVNLLCDFINQSKLAVSDGEIDPIDTPLAIMLKRALEAPSAEQLKIFKYLGDTSLYFAGFFQDHFTRKAVDIDYYITLGATAYNNLSGIMRDQHSDPHFSSFYSSLSSNFPDLVEIVAEVSDATNSTRSVDLLATYERWLDTNSDRLKRSLERAGIKPVELKKQ